MIFVPGAEHRKLEKSLGFAADSLILDLEDSVVSARVREARERINEFLCRERRPEQEWTVRVHATDTLEFFGDLQAIAPALPDALILPKTNGPEDIILTDSLLAGYEEQVRAERGRIRLLCIIETALGLRNAYDIARIRERVDGLILGHADLALSLGVQERKALEGIIFHARCQLVIAAKAAGKDAYDMVHLQIDDEEGLRQQTMEGLRMGFDGKLLVHPRQIGPVNEIYTPTVEEIQFATRVIEEYEAHLREGQAVFTVDGRMIDPPIVDVERKVLHRAEKAGALGERVRAWESS
ncbi:MAG: CoA ester lyase, partial [Gammaproteobacteria bacterium]|nr:CoA ester lyase [Gammaproteobacteria bacterium]